MANVGAANAYVTNWAEGLALGSFADAGNLPPDPGSHGSISIETYMLLPRNLSVLSHVNPCAWQLTGQVMKCAIYQSHCILVTNLQLQSNNNRQGNRTQFSDFPYN